MNVFHSSNTFFSIESLIKSQLPIKRNKCYISKVILELWPSQTLWQERKIQFFKSGFVQVKQVAGFTSYFSTVCKHHHATLLCQWHLPFSVLSDWCAPPLVSSAPYSLAHTLFFLPLLDLMFFSKHTHTNVLPRSG